MKMAKSTKATDPAKAAIDAVEEALKLDFGGPEDTSADDLDLDLDLDLDDDLRKAQPVENATLAASAKKTRPMMTAAHLPISFTVYKSAPLLARSGLHFLSHLCGSLALDSWDINILISM